MTTRDEHLAYLRSQPATNVLIIGAGANGIGTFRDLAQQGLDVLLVDAGDFCSGASAGSSHMIHGGIRYLENGEFRLVREAVRERNRLIQNAPHLARPLPTTIPIFRLASGLLNAPLKFLRLLDRPSERGALVIKIGLLLYDAYTGRQRTVPRHTFRSRQETLRIFPAMNPQVRWTATYYDGFMPTPERICIELVLDAEADHPGARALNYVRAISAADGAVTLRDELTGELLSVRPQIVINAAGPWIDLTNSALGQKTTFIGGTKGSHLIVDHPELRAAIGEHELFFENKDGRIVLLLPYYDRVMVGTSDIAVDNPDSARCTEEEVDYFLEMISRVFPGIRVDRSHIVLVFSAVRPLPASDARTTGQISRDHSIRVVDGPGFPILNLIGGKWTTYRAFSEQTADDVLRRLGRTRRATTRDTRIGGGRDYPASPDEQASWQAGVARQTGLAPERVATLFARYGTRAADIAAFIAQGNDQPLTDAPDYSRREIAYLALHERVIHLEDIALRRTTLGMQGRLTPTLIAELCTAASEALEWLPARQSQEIARLEAVLADQYAIHPG